MGDLEKDFQRWLRKQWTGWSASVEYGLGGDTGFPDMLFGEMHEFAHPAHSVTYYAELKVGQFKNGLLKCSEVRMDQIIWHNEARKHGMKTLMLVGEQFPDKGWNVYAVRSSLMGDWKAGYRLTGPDAGAFDVTHHCLVYGATVTEGLLGFMRSFI